MTYLKEGELPTDEKLARQTVFEAEQYFLKDEVLLHHYQPTKKRVDEVTPLIKQVVIPICLRKEVLQEFHDNNGHPGFDRCYVTLKEKYFWPKIYNDVREYCKTCDICQRAKIKTHFRRQPLNPLPSEEIFKRWQMDLIGPMPETAEGYKHVLVVVECLSRWPECFPLRTQHASEVADVLYNEVFCRYGAPVSLLSDRGQNFMSRLVTNLCKLFDVHRLRTSSFRPQTNSQCENFNRTILKCLRCYCEKQEDWNKYLQSIMAAFRATPCVSSTGFSPFQLLHGSSNEVPY